MSSNPTVRMSFFSTIAALLDGERITKDEWDNPDLYGELRNGRLMLHLADGWHPWIISEGDLMGQDWYIIY